jgi:tetratricopeptide (TPR) repeat protein
MTPRRRRIFALVAFSLPFVLILLLEGVLRLVGFGESFPLFVPVPEAPGFLQVNEHAVRRFVGYKLETLHLAIRPVPFRREKAPGTFRIFVQGGSSAEGFPYGFGASPAGMLQQRLQRTFPQHRIEVITTAVSAVNSYTLLDFVDEIIEQDPDAVVIYAGHNEYVGILGVGSGYSVARLPPVVWALVRVRQSSRIFQLLEAGIASIQLLVAKLGSDDSRSTLMAAVAARQPAIPYGSARYYRGIERYRGNLTAMLARYREAGVPVFIGTLASNLRDQPPFISGHDAASDTASWEVHFYSGQQALVSGDLDEALAELDKAIAIDDAANGHFARGQALAGLGRYDQARQAYIAAKERDELRFRAPEPINQVIHDVALSEGAHLVDVEGALTSEATNGIVGDDLMLEHVHPNLRGYFLLADAFYQAMQTQGIIADWKVPVSRDLAWQEIPVTEVERLSGEYEIARLTSEWPFVDQDIDYELPEATTPVVQIAQRYFWRRIEWPEAMRKLYAHYRSVGGDQRAAKVAVLLARAYPYAARQQAMAARALLRGALPLAGVYLGRAVELASTSDKPALHAARTALSQQDTTGALKLLMELDIPDDLIRR